MVTRCVCVSELGVPSSVDVVGSEPDHMVTSFSSGHIGLFNLETQQLVLKMDSHATSGNLFTHSRVFPLSVLKNDIVHTTSF